MKFSTILTSAFFALFIFISTATFATDYTTGVQENIQSFEKEDVHSIITIGGRIAEVTDEDRSHRSESYTMHVEVVKGTNVVAEATSNSYTLTLDLNDLEAGSYTFVIRTPTGTERKLVILD